MLTDNYNLCSTIKVQKDWHLHQKWHTDGIALISMKTGMKLKCYCTMVKTVAQTVMLLWSHWKLEWNWHQVGLLWTPVDVGSFHGWHVQCMIFTTMPTKSLYNTVHRDIVHILQAVTISVKLTQNHKLKVFYVTLASKMLIFSKTKNHWIKMVLNK